MSSNTTTTSKSMPIIPLNGLLDIQQYYFDDLEKTLNTNTNVATSLSVFQQRLADLNRSFTNANTSANGLLTEQDKIKDIIEHEYERISAAKEEIDNVHFGKMRTIELNDSYRKRHNEYIKMIIAIIIALLVYVLLVIFVPEPIYSISTIVLFSILLIYCANIIWEIYKRENVNHDRLDLKPPSGALTKKRDSEIKESSVLVSPSASTVCVGESCCASGSRWDASMNSCIISCDDTTTPISEGNTCVARCNAPSKLCGNACIGQNDVCGNTNQIPFRTLGDERIKTKHDNDNNVQPYSPFEYSEYAPI